MSDEELRSRFAHWLITQCTYDTKHKVIVALLSKLEREALIGVAAQAMFDIDGDN